MAALAQVLAHLVDHSGRPAVTSCTKKYLSSRREHLHVNKEVKMAKSLLYRLFGVGKIPEPLMSQLKNEGVILFDEGVKGSVTYRNFRAPGKRFSLRRQWFTGSIALTKTRLLGLMYSNTIINVPLADERIRAMHYSLEGDDGLCVAFDASLFHADWAGTIEYRFHTPQARQLMELLQEQTR